MIIESGAPVSRLARQSRLRSSRVTSEHRTRFSCD